MKKIILLLLFVLGGWQYAHAQNFSYGGLNYSVTSPTTVEVAENFVYPFGSPEQPSGSISIPAQINYNGGTYTVTGIGNSAFAFCDLTSVTIPNTVTTIGNNAFQSCNFLGPVTIPDSVTSIGDRAFYFCDMSMTSVNMSSSVTSIGIYAFYGCSQLTAITIPNTVTSIGSNAFENCFGLTTVTCNSVAPLSINSNVFQNVNQSVCALKVPAGSVAAYQSAPVWQNFSPISCSSPVVNTTNVSACNSYTWANNGQTYTTSGLYTGTTTDCLIEKLNLTIDTPSNFSSGGINYVVTSPTTVAVGSNPGVSGSIVIPASVTSACGTYTVTSVGSNAFMNCTNLTSIIIPNSVTSIGIDVFWSCSGLISVTIPNSVTSIGGGSFYFCSSLTSIILPNALTSLNESVFQGCSALTSIVIPETVTSIGPGAFRTCTSLASVTIPSSVTSIGGSAFFQCTSLTTLTCNAVIPPTTTLTSFIYVNQGACTLRVPAGSVAAYQAASVWQDFAPITCTSPIVNTTTVSACGNYTWANNGQTYTASGEYTGTTTDCLIEKLNLTITTPPSSFIVNGINYVVTSPTTVAVGNNSGISGDVIIPNSITTTCGTYAVTSIVSEAFFLLTGITSVSIPNSITNIGEGAFNGCTGLTVMTIPNSVTTIGNYAFINCTGLISVSLPNEITSINDGAFYGCSSLTSITIPSTVTSIGYQSFTSCSNLTSVTMPSMVTTIGDKAFGGCSSLTSISIPNSVTSIGLQAFALCTSLTSITIPNMLTSIANQTFQQCTSLTSVIISSSVTSIGNQAFLGCTNLTSVIIPNSVTSLGLRVFRDCTSLTSVTISNSLTNISQGTFYNCTSLPSVVIPNSVSIVGSYAFRGCFGLTSVTIPNTVTSIGDYAFYNCSGLTSVTYDNAVPLSINSTVFENVNQGACMLIVPTSSMASYQAAPVWQNFLFPINSTVVSSQCGSTLTTPYSTIACNPVAGATGYTFAITYNSITYTIVSSDAVINLSEATGMPIDFNAAYAISVSVQYGAFTSNYGTSCTVRTPIYQSTQLSNVSCGQTLASIGSLIYANINWNATAYRFKIENNTSGAIQYVDNSHQWFALNWLASYDYSTTYTVSVQLQIAGVWLGYYGPTCTVNTPDISSSNGSLQLIPSQCGTTLPSIGTVISTTPQAGATGYRFRITDVTPGATGSNLLQVKDRSYHWFTLPMLSRYNYGSTYMVEVALKTTGGYTNYGSPCYVTTPALPSLVNCGSNISTAGSLVYTTVLNSVSQYRFQVTNVSDQTTVTFDTNKYWFSFRVNVPGFTPNSAYSVRIAVMTAGTWSPFGDACEITSPAAAARGEEFSLSSFDVVAFPNPFAGEFKLNIATSTEGTVELKVYDMLGKLMEKRSINTIDYISEDLGSAYPAGVYNVIITQGENAKILRMIKR